MYSFKSVWVLAGLLLVALVTGMGNMVFFVLITGPKIPESLSVYASTVALTVGVIWLFFSTSMWIITDREAKTVAEAIEESDEKKFLREASKRISPGIWIIYSVATFATLVTFDVFSVPGGAELFAGALNLILSFLVIVVALFVYDSDDPFKGVVVLSNIDQIDAAWLKKLHSRKVKSA